jgi:hypothetical protein
MGQLKRALIEREEDARLQDCKRSQPGRKRSRVAYIATPTVGLAKRMTGEHQEK